MLAASDNTRNSRVLADESVPANSPGSRLWTVLHKRHSGLRLQ